MEKCKQLWEMRNGPGKQEGTCEIIFIGIWMNLRDRHYFVQRVHPGVATFLGIYSIDSEFFRKVRGGNCILSVGIQVLRQQGQLCLQERKLIQTGRRWEVEVVSRSWAPHSISRTTWRNHVLSLISVCTHQHISGGHVPSVHFLPTQLSLDTDQDTLEFIDDVNLLTL